MIRFFTCLFIPLLLLGCSGERVEGRGGDTDKWWSSLPRAEWAAYERVLPETPWFEVYKIRPGVFAIYEPGQFEEVISFLIIGDQRALLFDTGLGIGDMKAVTAALTDKPVTVLNSHSHYDHIGGNHQFTDIHGLETEFGLRRQAGISHEKAAEYVAPVWMHPDITAPGVSPDHYAIKPYALAEIVKDGDVIDLGNRALQVLHIPGHSPDSLALYDRHNGHLYVGDTFYPAPLYAHLEGSDVVQYAITARRLAMLVPNLKDVMTAHNVPIVSPDYLTELDAAFSAIERGDADFEKSDGAREYKFEGFSIITPQ